MASVLIEEEGFAIVPSISTRGSRVVPTSARTVVVAAIAG